MYFKMIAAELGQIPWAVLLLCRQIRDEGRLHELKDGYFALIVVVRTSGLAQGPSYTFIFRPYRLWINTFDELRNA